MHNAPGADDNGSGSVAAMTAARALAPLAFERTLRFINWCGEEQGLLGSAHYAQVAHDAGEKIVGVVNLDMVAYDEEHGSRDDTSCFVNDPSAWLGQYYVDVGHLYGVQHYFDLVNDPFETGSDHASFWAQGYDAIMLIEGGVGPGGLIAYPYYHTTQDTIDKLRMKLLVDNARTGAGTLAHLGRVTAVPVITTPAPKGPGVYVYPNPYKAGRDADVVHFNNVVAGSAVYVYDLAGRLVHRHDVTGSESRYDWPLRGDDGAAVGSGVYLWRVKGAGLDYRGKLAVIR